MGPDRMETFRKVLRGVISGSDPARLLHEALTGAVAASRGRQGLLVGVVDGVSSPLASTGAVPRLVVDVADAAIARGRLARRTGPDGSAAVAEPLRVGQRTVGALAVGGDARTLDPVQLPLFADCASLALARRPAPASRSVSEALDAVAGFSTSLDRAGVLVRLFDASEALFGARAGFCAVSEGDGMRIAHYRGLDLERLREASRHPEFKALLTSPGLRVDPPTHPVVATLAWAGETAVGLPLLAEGRRVGHLVLFLDHPPEAPQRALLTAFSRHAALALRSAELHRRVGDKEDLLASVVHSMANPVVVVDDASRFLLVNGAAAELFSLAGAFEVGQPLAGRLGHPTLEAMLAADEEGDLEVTLGSPAPSTYRASVRRVRSSGGRTLGRVVVLDDITRERETDQLKADFVAVIGHELRTPITIMKGYVRTLLRRGEDMDGAKRQLALGAIDANAGRLERLIEDLLLVSAMESSRPPVALAQEDLGVVVETAVADVAERVAVQRAPAPLRFALDRAKVEQVLHHLLDNALKYSDGPVQVEVLDHGDEVEIAVVDRGPGIFSGDVAQLFERFRQLDGSSTRAHGGTGLGLYICRRLVELQGGRIWCESRLGVGSRFAFTVPRRQPEPALAAVVDVGS